MTEPVEQTDAIGAIATSAVPRIHEASQSFPLVSVVMPTFNRAKLLERALRSALNQTYGNLEIIVVDDASDDNTAEFVAQIRDKRIKYIRHDTNKGGSAARNTGIRAATGKYIAFLDDDDIWEPQKTQEQLSVLVNYDAALCDYSMDGTSSSGVTRRETHGVVTLDELRKGFYLGASASALIAHAEILLRTLFDEDLPKCQDWDLCIRIAQKYTIGFVNKPLLHYSDGPHERISNRILKLPAPELERHLRMLRKHEEFFGEKWFNRHMCTLMLYGIRHRLDKGRHIRYVTRRYGVLNVFYFLARRFYQMLAHSLRFENL